MTGEEEKKKPKFSKKIGNITGSIFVNKVTTDKGSFDMPSIVLQKSYVISGGDPNNTNDWRNPSITLSNVSEIDKAILVLQDIKRIVHEKGYQKTED